MTRERGSSVDPFAFLAAVVVVAVALLSVFV
jgi:hypothetical protein